MTAWILSASILTLSVILLRLIFRKKIGRGMQYALWGIVMLRLLIPFSLFESPISVQNALTEAESQREIYVMPVSEVPVSDAHGVGVGEGGEVIFDANSAGYAVVSEDGKTVTRYLDKISAEELFRFIWIFGSAVTGIWFTAANAVFYRQLKKTRKPFECEKSSLPVYVSDSIASPCLFGIIRPAVYLTPKAAVHENGTEHVLAHEFCHLKHGDNIWSAVRGICLAVWWWNPLVWAAAYMSRTDAELACDEAAIKKIGEKNRLAYGRTLVDMIALKPGAGGLMCTATTMTSGKRGIKERLNMIIKNPRAFIPAVITVLIIAVICVGCTFTGAQTQDKAGVFVTVECDEEAYSIEWTAKGKSGSVDNADGTPFSKGSRVLVTDEFEGTVDYSVALKDKDGGVIADGLFSGDFEKNTVEELLLTEDMGLVSKIVYEVEYSVSKVDENGKVLGSIDSSSGELKELARDIIMDMMVKSAAFDGKPVSELGEHYMIRETFGSGETHDFYAYIVTEGTVTGAVLQAGDGGYYCRINDELYAALESMMDGNSSVSSVGGADEPQKITFTSENTDDTSRFAVWKDGERVCDEFALHRSVIELKNISARMNSNGTSLVKSGLNTAVFSRKDSGGFIGDMLTVKYLSSTDLKQDEAQDEILSAVLKYISLDNMAQNDNYHEMQAHAEFSKIQELDPTSFFGKNTPITRLIKQTLMNEFRKGEQQESVFNVYTIYYVLCKDRAAAFCFLNAQDYDKDGAQGWKLIQSENDCENWMKTLAMD